MANIYSSANLEFSNFTEQILILPLELNESYKRQYSRSLRTVMEYGGATGI